MEARVHSRYLIWLRLSRSARHNAEWKVLAVYRTLLGAQLVGQWLQPLTVRPAYGRAELDLKMVHQASVHGVRRSTSYLRCIKSRVAFHWDECGPQTRRPGIRTLDQKME